MSRDYTSSLEKSSSHSHRDVRVAVIREEFIALTKDPLVAVVLNQLVYWTQRVKDFDFFLREEQDLNPRYPLHPRHGWIYKTAEELIEETMLEVSKSTMLRYLNVLLTGGWIDKRTNSADKWDKTTQYRVNLRKLQDDLLQLGYALPGSTLQVALPSISSHGTIEFPKFQNETSNFQNETSKSQNQTSRFQNETSNTETTTKTIPEITNKELLSADAYQKNLQENVSDCLSFSHNSTSDSIALIPQKMLELWKNHVGQEGLILTENRKAPLLDYFQRFFKKELADWEEFCLRVKSSAFLMGEGARKWRVGLDWVLREENLQKILAGNYNNPKEKNDFSTIRTGPLSLQQKKQICEVLKQIEDPSWRQFCTALPFNPKLSSYVPLWQLQEIVPARFLGLEDERLAWVACRDYSTLSQIGNLQLQLLNVIQKIYPKASAIRACLESDNPFKGAEVPHKTPPSSSGDSSHEN